MHSARLCTTLLLLYTWFLNTYVTIQEFMQTAFRIDVDSRKIVDQRTRIWMSVLTPQSAAAPSKTRHTRFDLTSTPLHEQAACLHAARCMQTLPHQPSTCAGWQLPFWVDTPSIWSTSSLTACEQPLAGSGLGMKACLPNPCVHRLHLPALSMGPQARAAARACSYGFAAGLHTG